MNKKETKKVAEAITGKKVKKVGKTHDHTFKAKKERRVLVGEGVAKKLFLDTLREETGAIIRRPIFNNHNWEEKLGEITLNKEGQGLLNKKSVFSIGFIDKDDKAELVEISLTDDDTYFEALKKEREAKKVSTPKRFCSHCGREMIERDVPAEKYNRLLKVPNHPAIHSYLPNKAFDDETGDKLYVKQYICPRYHRPFSNHDCFSIGEPFTK